MPLQAGDHFGPWLIEGLLGEGGTAVVYRARQPGGPARALKVLGACSPTAAQRTRREARVQQDLHHPNVVHVHELVTHDQQLALVLDLVRGPSLRQLLDVRPLTPAQVDDVARQTLDAMAAAHAAGFVHRDLKPANLLLELTDDAVTVRVTDFGLVKFLDGDRMTATGSTFGTPAYIAPEQLQDASKVDARADVWSLGAILQELVTHERAFQGPDVLELLRAVTSGAAQPLPDDLPPSRAAVIRDALQTDPTLRPPDAGVLLERWAPAHGTQPWSSADRAQLAQLAGLTAPAQRSGCAAWLPARLASLLAGPPPSHPR